MLFPTSLLLAMASPSVWASTAQAVENVMRNPRPYDVSPAVPEGLIARPNGVRRPSS
jgi:hypothetical protein